MSYPSEKSPAAMAALLGSTLSSDGISMQQPPPYDHTLAQPSSDNKLPVYDGSLSPTSPLTSPSTTSLASLEDVSRPGTSSTKLFISQSGNRFRPWPWSNPSDLVTPIFDSNRSFPLYTSTRFTRNSGSCVMVPVYSTEDLQSNPTDRFEVHTTYTFGPGNDPVISCDFGEGKGRVETTVGSKGKLTRSRWFNWNGDRYEWRYVGKRNASGMVLQRVVSKVPDIPEIVITEEKRPETHASSCCKGKARKSEDEYVTVADFRRAEEESKKCVISSAIGCTPAGEGGWVTIYEKEGEGKKGLPEWLVLSSCMVMLKRERDRRAMHIAVVISAAVSGGP